MGFKQSSHLKDLMNLIHTSLYSTAVIAASLWWSSTLWAQFKVDDLTTLLDQTIDVQLAKGKFEVGGTVTRATAASLPGGIKALKIRLKNSKKQRSINLSKVEELFIDERPLDIVYNKKSRCLIHSPEKRSERLRSEKKASDRLAVNGDRLWQLLTADEHLQFVQRHKEFLDQVKQRMASIPFRLVETEYFLFMTDLQPVEVDGYIAYLDAMYEELCKAFNIPRDKNIWCGKCVVVAFRSERDYLQFEFDVMKNPIAKGTQGMCHSYGDGKVIFAGFKGKSGFGHVLVHETSHGFVHRYKSTARAPSWLNEGMSDWLAGDIVKSDRNLRDQRLSATRVMQSPAILQQFMNAQRIDGDMYGAASAMVEILLAIDKGGQFKAFFDAIKIGNPPEQALKESFGLSYQNLAALYIERIQRLKR